MAKQGGIKRGKAIRLFLWESHIQPQAHGLLSDQRGIEGANLPKRIHPYSCPISLSGSFEKIVRLLPALRRSFMALASHYLAISVSSDIEGLAFS
jgi:hypothetical protein